MIRARVLLGALVIVLAHEASGGSLRDREKEIIERSAAKSEKKKESTSRSSDNASTTSFGSGSYPSSRGDGLFSGFWSWIIAAPFQYGSDDAASSLLDNDGSEDGWADDPHSFFPKHTRGQATAPNLRFDYNQQYIESASEVHDARMELGYKLFAFHGRMTRYIEEDGFTLNLNQFYGVLRYGGSRPDFLPGTFEIGIGAGVVYHGGDLSEDSSGALTIPVKYHPTDWFGIEFRPAWYHWQEIAIGDYDLSASLGYRFVQLRGGYRWIWDNGIVDEQSGPYAGVTISF